PLPPPAHPPLPPHPHTQPPSPTFSFFFNAPATTAIYTTRHTLSLHDALPIWMVSAIPRITIRSSALTCPRSERLTEIIRSEEHTSELQSRLVISYAVFCL